MPVKSESHPTVVACYHVHDDTLLLSASIESLCTKVPVIVFVSRLPWSGEPGDWESAATIAKEAGAEVVLGDWASESEHRLASLEECKKRGIAKMLIPDGDEVFEEQLLDQLLKVAKADIADRVYVQWDTYWKTPDYVVRPREGFTPCMLVDPNGCTHSHVRDYRGGRGLLLGAEHGIVHHLSYVGDDARIKRKVTTWSHKDEVVPGWWQCVWKAWDKDKSLFDLHPTHPPAYRFVERIHRPKELAKVLPLANPVAKRPKPKDWPKVSVVVPVYGGEDVLRTCIQSLEGCSDLVHETIVVDNASPDGCKEVCRTYTSVSLIENSENLGFARACNQGAEASTGEVVLFLNSDTVVPRDGLLELMGPLITSATVGATGPYTNECGHFQRTQATYTSLDTLDLFADDFARREADDKETDMLVGFCIAVRKSALSDVGLFDERFGLGLFEDNDLCYRLRRAGWRLVIAAKAFVHHEGSKTLRKVGDTERRLRGNAAIFEAKWRQDLESGFASHISGTSPQRIQFNEERRPESLAKAIERKRKQANVSLCMIVRDEERVMADCLRSASPFFEEKIIVDTGSKDRTVEIAESFGAEVRHMEWPDSFSVARNESLKGAKGDWVFWMDADDTLPPHCGEAILDAAINAPNDVHGFIVPVQFVEEGPGAGTRVDHVKLFRNLPGVEFEGRIHEQILGTLRQHGGEIARCGAYVLHSGYDNSIEGQKKKRTRDERLLKLDLEDRPGHPFVLFNLGMTAHYTQGHEEAVDWLQQSIAAAQPHESHVRKAYALMAVSLRELRRSEEAVAKLEEALTVVGEDPEIRFHLGLLKTNAGEFEDAARNYEMALSADTSWCFTSMDVGIKGFKTRHNLAGVYAQLGRYSDAKEQYLLAMREAPQFLPSAFELFDQALAVGDAASSKAAMDHVERVEGQSKNWLDMGKKRALATGGESALAEFLKTFHANGSSPEAVKSYAKERLESGDIEEGRRALVTIADQDPEAAYYLGVEASRRGDFVSALEWMQRSLALNPGHDETAGQVENLKRLLSENGE